MSSHLIHQSYAKPHVRTKKSARAVHFFAEQHPLKEPKPNDMIYRLLLPALALLGSACSPKSSPSNAMTTPQATNIDYAGFLQLSQELQTYRQERTIDLSTYAKMLEEEGVLLLDTRSAQAFQAIHIKGATHLNFSDFTEDKLAAVIPSKETTILIYCNNNFRNAGIALATKSAPLALNIPTFINLYGYGYKNIYELKGNYTLEEAREYLEFEETESKLLKRRPVSDQR